VTDNTDLTTDELRRAIDRCIRALGDEKRTDRAEVEDELQALCSELCDRLAEA
jgi:hypothetical protein